MRINDIILQTEKFKMYVANKLKLIFNTAMDSARAKRTSEIVSANGFNIRYIQECLGRRNNNTAEIYTNRSTSNFQQINTPFDD